MRIKYVMEIFCPEKKIWEEACSYKDQEHAENEFERAIKDYSGDKIRLVKKEVIASYNPS